MILSSGNQKTLNSAIQLSCAYLGTLFVALVVFWWAVLIGTHPLSPQLSFLAAKGPVKPGQIASIKHSICSANTVSVDIFASLNGPEDRWFPIPSGVTTLSVGCHDIVHEFTVPDIEDGEWVYKTKIKYQTNMVGRDDTIDLSPVRIMVEK